MNFNYKCPPVAVIARGLVRPLWSAENRFFSGEMVIREANALGLGWFYVQQKFKRFENMFRTMIVTAQVHASANDLRHCLHLGSPAASRLGAMPSGTIGVARTVTAIQES